MLWCCVLKVIAVFAEQVERRSRGSLETKYYRLINSNKTATEAAAATALITPPVFFTPPLPPPPAAASASDRWIAVYCNSNRRNGQYRGQWTVDCGKDHKHSRVCDRQHGVGEFKNEERGIQYSGEWQHGK